MLDKVLLVLLKRLPVLRVLAQVDFINRPEAGHLVLVHLPDIVVLDGQNDEAVGILFEQGLWLDFLSLGAVDGTDL